MNKETKTDSLWYNPFDEYDLVYMSKVFSFTEDFRQYMTNAKNISNKIQKDGK